MLIDTGPLVAIVDRRDGRHRECLNALKRTSGPLFTVWPVIAEAVHLLRRVPGGAAGLFNLIDAASVAVPNVEFDLAWLREFFDRYDDQRPDLADACLVQLAEMVGTRRMFTLDVKDFRVYRVSGKVFEIVPLD